MSAMAFLAGMGAGYMSGKDKQIERDRQAAKDKREQDAFDMQKKTFDQTQADKATLRAAGAPVGVMAEQGPPTEAQYAATPAGQEPDAIGYMVGSGPTARDFATKGLADAAAAPQNTPQGTQSRQVAALQATGDYAGAQKLRSETAKATEEEQKIADSTVRRSIGALKTHDAVTQYMTDSPADKMGGGFSAKAVKGADGMIDYMQVLPDGTLKSTGQRFTDDAAGIEKARQTLAGYMTPEQRIAQAQHDITNALAAKESERKAKHDDGTLAVAQQNANTTEQWRRDQATAGFARGGAGRPAAEVAFDPLGNFDAKKAQAVAFEQVSKSAEASAAAGKPMTAQEQGQQAQELYRASADAFASENTRRHVASVVSTELRGAKDPATYAATYAKALQTGMDAKTLAANGFKPPPAPAAPAGVAAPPPAPPKPAPYMPPANSPAARALAARSAAQISAKEQIKIQAEDAAQQRLRDAAEENRLAAEYRLRNNATN